MVLASWRRWDLFQYLKKVKLWSSYLGKERVADSEIPSQLWLQEQAAGENTWNDRSYRGLEGVWESLIPGDVNMLSDNESSFTTE